MPIEMRVYPESPLPPASELERFGRLSTSLVSDVVQRWAGAPALMPVAGLAPGQVVVGAACTVRTRQGDNLAVHQALELVRPGEVLVVAAEGSTSRAIIGGLMGHYASTRSVAAIVIDGAVRDLTDLGRRAPPVFARGVTHLGPYKDGPGEIRGPVSIAGAVVEDGDLVMGDEDGLAFVPRARAEEILELAEAKGRAEAKEDAAIANGRWDRSWLAKSVTMRRVERKPPDGLGGHRQEG